MSKTPRQLVIVLKCEMRERKKWNKTKHFCFKPLRFGSYLLPLHDRSPSSPIRTERELTLTSPHQKTWAPFLCHLGFLFHFHSGFFLLSFLYFFLVSTTCWVIISRCNVTSYCIYNPVLCMSWYSSILSYTLIGWLWILLGRVLYLTSLFPPTALITLLHCLLLLIIKVRPEGRSYEGNRNVLWVYLLGPLRDLKILTSLCDQRMLCPALWYKATPANQKCLLTPLPSKSKCLSMRVVTVQMGKELA